MYGAKVATRNAGRNWDDPNSPKSVNNPPTIRQAAAAAGVAPSMVIDAKRVRRDAIPEVTAAVERGIVSSLMAPSLVSWTSPASFAPR